MEMEVTQVYTSVACNRTPNCADWGHNGYIVFAANNAVALMDPRYYGSCKIICTYVQHLKKVNCVKWIKSSKEKYETEVISGSDDKTAIIWNLSVRNKPTYKILKGHEDGIYCVEALYENEILTAATLSADSTVKLWHKNENSEDFECFQTVILENKFGFALRLTTLPLTNQILLLYSAADNNIHLLSEDRQNNERNFIRIYKLIGHEDWVRSIDFIQVTPNELLIASAGQDTFIRLWKISAIKHNFDNKHSANEIGFLDHTNDDIQMEQTIIKTKMNRYSVTLESVLQGHEGWIYGVHWNMNENGIQLLSSSIDKTLITWIPNEEGIWMEKLRFGEVGGNTLGFLGGRFSSDGKSLFGHSFHGSFHIWSQAENNSVWEPQIQGGGHSDIVRDLGWEPSGNFLFTVSDDFTTRIHTPWTITNQSEVTWHEIARPQIHGYNIQCIAILSRYKFASGAGEKIIRVFEAPANFVENFRRICKIELDSEGAKILQSMPKGASVPSLGLSNKAVYDVDKDNHKLEKHFKDEYPENNFVPIVLSSPPQEEFLMQNSLWPEIQKLYGHGFEIFALCASSDGKLLASSCKATSNEHAQIIVWNTSTWKQIQKLSSHQLTITQIKFSPNNQYLLSVSRDRRWTLFENKSLNELANFEVAATTDKRNGIHGRIIWSCDWSHDTKFFGTASRDGKAVMWTKSNTMTNTSLRDWESVSHLELNESITAIAFAPFYIKNEKGNYFISLGLESGLILLYKFSNSWEKLFLIDKQNAHHSTVQKLQFRPYDKEINLASCGADNFVRIHKICMK